MSTKRGRVGHAQKNSLLKSGMDPNKGGCLQQGIFQHIHQYAEHSQFNTAMNELIFYRCCSYNDRSGATPT